MLGLLWVMNELIHLKKLKWRIPILGLPRWYSGKESVCQCKRYNRCGFNPWAGKIPWSKKWQPTPVFLPGKFHGWRSLAGYSSRGHKQLDMTGHACTQANLAVLDGPKKWFPLEEVLWLPFCFSVLGESSLIKDSDRLINPFITEWLLVYYL